MYPRRGYDDHWYAESGRPHGRFWQDGPREGQFWQGGPREGQFWQDGPHEYFESDGPHPSWDQYHPEKQWEHSRWEHNNNYNHHFPGNFESGSNYSGNVPYRGSYRRRPRGNFHKKSHHHGHFNKGPKSSFSKERGDVHNSSHSSNLINVTTNKKESDSEKAKAPSATPKEPKQDQTASATLTKTSNPCQVQKKTSKAVISAQDFSFRLPDDSSANPQSKQKLPPKKPEEIELVEPGVANLKAEDGHRLTPCDLAGALSSSVTLGNLRILKEEEETVPIQLNDRQATEVPSSQTASLPSAEVLSEQQGPSQATEGFHSTVKEELVQVAETKQDMTHPSVTDLSSVPPAPLEDREAILCLGKKVQLKGSQTAEDLSHCTTPLTSVEAPAEQPAPFKTAKDFHSMEKEESVQTQMASSHEDGDHNQISVALTSGSSSLLTTTSDVHSVPVLVREKEIDLSDFWEIPSLHAEQLRGWAPEDYQEPPQSMDKADKCDRMPDHGRDLAPNHSSPHTRVSCDKKSDTRRVLEGCSCSPKSHYSSDSRHSSTNWTPWELHVQSPPRRGRSPPPRRVRSPPPSPPRQGRSSPPSPPRRGRSLPRRGRSPPPSLPRRGRSPPRRGRSPPRRGRSPSRWGRSPPPSPLRRGRSPLRRGRSLPRSPPQVGWSPARSSPRSPPQRGWSPLQSSPKRDWGSPQSPPQQDWSPLRSSPKRDWGSPRSPPQRGWSPLRSSPRRDLGSPQSSPKQDHYHFRDLRGSPGRRKDNFGTESYSLYHHKSFKQPSHERCQERDSPHKKHHHHSPKGRSKSYRVPHSYSPESPTAGEKKKKLTHSEVTEKKRATSGKRTKPLKIKKKAREAQSPASHDSLPSAVEAAIPPTVTENVQPVRRKESQLIQMTEGSEDPDFPCRHAGDENGSSTQSRTPSDRSAAVLARKEEIEQAYQEVLLNFATVAIMLLEMQPCMTEAMEAALQANLRRFGNYYEHKLKDFIDRFDLTEDT